ncbi:MAG: GNAT family N-acetyltransferase [Oscillospiraceae bacterium]|nr:GNAT family N-acetyltransferase [Oscillospiraceae bacterium]
MSFELQNQIDYETYTRLLNDFKRANRGCITNMYLLRDALENALSGRNMAAQSEGCLLLLVLVHGTYWRVYYTAKDAGILRSALADLTAVPFGHQPLICDIVGKREKVTEEAEIFQECGFIIRRKMARSDTTKRRMAKYPKKFAEDVEFARAEDAPEILVMLKDEFDVYSQQLPDLDDLLEEIAQQGAIVVRRDGRVAAFELFQINGAVFWGRFAYTKEAYRKEFLYMKIAEFARELMEAQGVKKVVSWVDEDNTALQRNRIKGGDVFEDMVDYVLMYSQCGNQAAMHG